MDLFYDPEFDPISPTLNKEESHHCLRVLRHTLGDSIGVLNGKGTRCEGTIEDTAGGLCTLKITQMHTQPAPDSKVSIAVAIPKSNDRIEWMVEKATELGVSEIFPIYSEYSERRKANTERMTKKAISAIKQSHNPFLPIIHPIQSLESLLDSTPDWKRFIANQGGVQDINTNPSDNLMMLVGPEGGFSQEEINLAKSHNLVEVSLANHILRTETAGVLAVSFLHNSIE